MAKQASEKQAAKKRSKTVKRARAPRGRAQARSRAKARSTAKPKTLRRPTGVKKAAKRKKAPPKKPSTLGAVATVVRGTVAGAVAAVARRVSKRPATDAITLLEADHRRMQDLLKQGEETTERAVKGRRELLDRLTAELTVHELIEEQVLYPALQR